MLISRTDLLDTSEKAMLLLLTFCMVPQKLDTQSRGLLVRQTWMPLDVAFRFKSRLLAYAFARTCRSARQRYGIIFIHGLFFRIFFLFPHPLLLSLLQMHHRGHLVADAHVRPAVVVEVEVTRDEVPGVLIRRQSLLAVDTFHLYYTVDALCDGIFRRLVVLRHGYADVVGLKQGYICVAAVLYSAVGMVDKPLEGFSPRHSHGLFNGHLQGFDADGCTECPGQSPADDLVRVGIGDKMQVTHVATIQCNVGDSSTCGSGGWSSSCGGVSAWEASAPCGAAARRTCHVQEGSLARTAR